MQTQTSNTLHNAIMEAGSKDRPPMLAPDWKDIEVPVSEGSPITITERIHETYKNVLQEIRDQLNAKAKAVQIILTGIDNDIYSTVDACPNACEMWKAIKRGKAIVNSPQPIYDQEPSMVAEDDKASKEKEIDKLMALISLSFKKIYKPTNNNLRTSSNTSRANQDNSPRINRSAGKREKAVVNSHQPIYDQEPSMVDDDDEDTSKEKEIDKLMPLISLSFKKIYKPTNNNLRTSSNTSRANQDNSPRIHRNAGYEGQMSGTVAGARDTVGSSKVQKSGIQCYNCKEYGHIARECQKPKRTKDAAYHQEKMLLSRECQKPKRAKDAAYHREKMLLCKQEETGIQLNVDQADWRDDTYDDELEDQELEAHYMYMAQLQQCLYISCEVIGSCVLVCLDIRI
nr:hypothetical protein [Tanacetum cinerariifolium]